jgi:hypothetical protein
MCQAMCQVCQRDGGSTPIDMRYAAMRSDLTAGDHPTSPRSRPWSNAPLDQ